MELIVWLLLFSLAMNLVLVLFLEHWVRKANDSYRLYRELLNDYAAALNRAQVAESLNRTK